MISYDPLWETMRRTNISTYTLQKKSISSSTISRMKKGQPVSVYTIDKLCTLLDCNISDVIEFIKDESSRPL